MENTTYIIGQVLGAVSLVIICFGFFASSRKVLLMTQIFGNIFYASSFLVLGVYVGGVNTVISVFRVLVFYLYERKGKTAPKWFVALIICLYVPSLVLFFDDGWDVLSFLSSSTYTIGLYIKDELTTKSFLIIPNVLLVLYNFVNSAISNGILNTIEFAMLVIAVVRIIIKRKEKKKLGEEEFENRQTVSKILTIINDKKFA